MKVSSIFMLVSCVPMPFLDVPMKGLEESMTFLEGF